MWENTSLELGVLLVLLKVYLLLGLSVQAWASTALSEKLLPLLDRFQFLNKATETWAVSPRIPSQVKVAMSGALLRDDLEIHPFNLDRKEKYGFPASLGGIVIYPQGKVQFQTPLSVFLNTFDSSNSRAIQKMREDSSEDWFKKDYVLFLPDAPIPRAAYNPLLVMAHELAHVSFHRRLAQLKLRIDRDLFTYLSERYAHEIEFLLLKSLKGDRQHFFITPRKWIDMAQLTEGPYARRKIGAYVREVYQLRHPSLAKYDRYTVEEILNSPRFEP